MHVDISPSDPAGFRSIQEVRLQRVRGRAELGLKSAPGGKDRAYVTRLQRCFQEGDAKIRFPRTDRGAFEAVLINTAGGLTGGDRLEWQVDLGARTCATLSTPACEKIYRSTHGATKITTKLKVGDNACLNWLPQETILFNRASLQRKLEVELAPGARFFAVEAVVLGRKSMGETVSELSFRDRWRVCMQGRLVHGDDMLFGGNILGTTNVNASLADNKAFASLLYVGPESDEAMAKLVDELRRSRGAATYGFSTYGGKIVGRMLAADSYTLRASLLPILKKFMRGAQVPKVWTL